MYTNIPLPILAVAAAILLVLYFLIAGFTYRKQIAAILMRPSTRLQMNPAGISSDRYFSPLIDKPADHPIEQAHFIARSEEGPEDSVVDRADDEPGKFLLKEAEWVVEQIQDVVDHLASRPANPDEVFTKIRQIVSQYTIFQNTEYEDAINNFVAVTVQRDCDLALTAEDLKALWWKEAA